MRDTVFIKIQTVPLLEEIKHRHSVGKRHLEIRSYSLTKMFQFTDLPEQAEERFNQHPVVPLDGRADFQVFRLISPPPEAFVRQNNHFVPNGSNRRQKLGIGNICRFELPIGNQSELVGQQTQFTADNPSPGGKAFFADSRPMRLMP